jgi:tetratricopeptide (TPR) repeat protein
VAVKYPGFSGAADALYSIVLSLAGLVSGENSQRPLIKQKLVEASTEFVSMFPADERSKATQINVAKMLFDSGDHTGAIEAAEYALNQWQLSASLGKTAALISAHSHFELGHYQLAELGYRDLLLRDRSNGEKGSSEITDRLLASVFKQAEAAELSNDIPRAIEHLLALEEIDAASDLAIDAAYDTAALYEQLGQIDQAVNQLKVFRQNHPQHAASDGIAMRLVALYEQAGRLGDSANELIAVHGSEKFSTDVQQQALFRAGELYLEDAALPQALDAFRLYAHSYRQPFGLTMEAMHHMDLLYQQTGEVQKRQFWLRKKMLAYGNADPANRDDRTRFLAVDASFILAEVELAAFRGIALKQPLNESLQKKHKAMKVAVDAFERTSAFGVAGFVEGATYHIGGIYQSLAESLMASDRPPGLNELEAEQYDILLEEQAFPFEEQAIDIHKVNLNRAWKETWNSWVGQSLTALENLSPGRYRRKEMGVPYVETLY